MSNDVPQLGYPRIQYGSLFFNSGTQLLSPSDGELDMYDSLSTLGSGILGNMRRIMFYDSGAGIDNHYYSLTADSGNGLILKLISDNLITQRDFVTMRRSNNSGIFELNTSIFTIRGVLGTNTTSWTPTADGAFVLQNNAGSGFDRIQLGGTSASFPCIRRTGTVLEFMLADVSAYANVRASGFAGGFSAVKTALYTLVASDPTNQVCDPTGGAFTVTLPAANSVPAGRAYAFMSITAGANNLTVSRAGADTIQVGATNSTTNVVAPGGRLNLASDGVSIWYRNI